MYDTAYLIGTSFLKTYGAGAGLVIEIGSYNVNGSLRDAAPPGCRYVGLDLEPGPDVDVVGAAGRGLPFADGCADLVLASSVFEHDPAFWLTFREMCRITRPGGYIYVSAPANGFDHRFPLDCWRLYPDAGLALAQSAARDDVPATLVESFVSERLTDVWNDFTAVFQRAGGANTVQQRLHWTIPCTNVHDAAETGPLLREDPTEDMRLLAATRSDLVAARNGLAHAELQATALLQASEVRATQWAAERSRQAAELHQLRAALAIAATA